MLHKLPLPCQIVGLFTSTQCCFQKKAVNRIFTKPLHLLLGLETYVQHTILEHTSSSSVLFDGEMYF